MHCPSRKSMDEFVCLDAHQFRKKRQLPTFIANPAARANKHQSIICTRRGAMRVLTFDMPFIHEATLMPGRNNAIGKGPEAIPRILVTPTRHTGPHRAVRRVEVRAFGPTWVHLPRSPSTLPRCCQLSGFTLSLASEPADHLWRFVFETSALWLLFVRPITVWSTQPNRGLETSKRKAACSNEGARGFSSMSGRARRPQYYGASVTEASST